MEVVKCGAKLTEKSVKRMNSEQKNVMSKKRIAKSIPNGQNYYKRRTQNGRKNAY